MGSDLPISAAVPPAMVDGRQTVCPGSPYVLLFCLGEEEVRIPLRDLRPVGNNKGRESREKDKGRVRAVFWGRRKLGVEGGSCFY